MSFQKRVKIWICLAACSSLLLALNELGSEEPPDWSGTLRIDGERLRVDAFFDDARTQGFVRIGGWTSRVYQAWSIALADLDDDGVDEVLLGIWSRQKRHDEPEPHRTVWVLDWDGKRLVETWRGSALARPLIDFAAVQLDGNGADELIAYERDERGCWLTAYRWGGFGFYGLTRAAVPCGGTLSKSACLSVREITQCAQIKGQRLEFR